MSQCYQYYHCTYYYHCASRHSHIQSNEEEKWALSSKINDGQIKCIDVALADKHLR